MPHFRDLLTPGSRVRYAWWRLSRSRQPVTVTLDTGASIIMRPGPERDYRAASNIFLRALYRWPRGEPVSPMRHVVDVGAHVGYTIVDWARRFPASRIEAFEPHPRHLSMIKQHLELNALQARVTLHESAAGCAPRDALLVDAGPCANAIAFDTTSSAHTQPIHVSDFFATVGHAPIDLLKLNAEGAEYSLLADPRFGDLDVRALVVEWHARADGRDGGEWCRDRLARAGYRTSIVWRDAANDAGLLWAFPPR
jgi:FkbM family methyltransferase